MEEITKIGLDLAKSVFQVHGADHDGNPVLRKKLRRGQLLDFSASCRPALSAGRPVPAPTTGHASCSGLAMRLG